MYISTQLVPWLSGFGVAALTYAACSWWHRRRLAETLGRMHKIDRARQTAELHVQQSRRQIEQLQKDLAALHRARAEALTMRKRAQAMAEINRAFEREVAVRPNHRESSARPALPPDGFADTQPI
jgi:hypothetical protein